MLSIDLNCDMGESSELYPYDIGKDMSLMKYVSSVNLACGLHAGDAQTMHLLVECALKHHVAVGAHPGFPDRANFGRTNLQLPPGMIYDLVLYQLGALHAFLKIYKSRLHHVKPHGGLYNMAAKQRPVADAIANAIKDFDDGLILYGLSGSEMIRAGAALGLRTASEVFADRTYQEDGSLTPRTEPNALLNSPEEVVTQVLEIVNKGTVKTVNGNSILINAETICIHGDGEHAVDFAAAIREVLG